MTDYLPNGTLVRIGKGKTIYRIVGYLALITLHPTADVHPLERRDVRTSVDPARLVRLTEAELDDLAHAERAKRWSANNETRRVEL